MNNKVIFLLIAFVFCNILNAQQSTNEVLFTVDKDPVLVKEFKRVYNKNLELVKDESQKDVDAYMKLFVNYKLKLKEAKALGLNEKPQYKRELANYRKQLAKNYLTDSNVTDALTKEAYERISNEIRARHILVRVSESAKPEDTLIAYNKLLEARNKILGGDDFIAIAKQYSEDPSAAENGGDLGFFGGFRMVYSFESAAYNTPKGEVSLPFRTRFGYHIVKVTDQRKSMGEVTVAHIMVANKKDNDSLKQLSETRIRDIYKKLQQGEKFESLAKQFSEDKASAKKGGLLNKFGKGQLSSTQFEEAAFALAEKEQVSEPIETDFGWHIIKLVNKHPVASFEDMKKELEVKIKRDSRSKLINEAFAEKLKVKYKLTNKQPLIAEFVNILNDAFYKKAWKIPEGFDVKRTLFTVGNKTVTTGDFANHLVTAQRKLRERKTLEAIVNDNYKDFLNTSVLTYYEDNLENENEEFAIVVNEYRDGLLLFDLMESQVWNAAKTDSTGLQDFYSKHAANYIWPKRAVATVASSANKGIMKKVNKLLGKGVAISKIKETLNTKDKLNVIFTQDTMQAKHQALPKDFMIKKGISKIQKYNDAYTLVDVKDVIESKPKTFEEARGKVISDYQAYIEENWLKALHDKYSVTIDDAVLSKVKQEIKN